MRQNTMTVYCFWSSGEFFTFDFLVKMKYLPDWKSRRLQIVDGSSIRKTQKLLKYFFNIFMTFYGRIKGSYILFLSTCFTQMQINNILHILCAYTNKYIHLCWKGLKVQLDEIVAFFPHFNSCLLHSSNKVTFCAFHSLKRTWK